MRVGLKIAAFFGCVVLLSTTALLGSEFDEQIAESVKTLTEGVDALPQTGAPGPIVSLDDSAFPVVLGEYEDGVYESVVAAAFVGKGRVVAYGHTEYCGVNAINLSDSSRQLFFNAIFWASGKNSKDNDTAKTIKIAVFRDEKTAEFLKEKGFDAVSVANFSSGFDLYVGGSHHLSDRDFDALFASVREGAGFITCGLGWGWSQLNPGKSLTRDHSGNRNFTKFGVPLAWTNGMLEPTTNGGYKVENDLDGYSPFVRPSLALDFISNCDLESLKEKIAKLDPRDVRQLSSTLTLVYGSLPADRKAQCDKVVSNLGSDIVPSEKNPVRSEDVLERLIASIQVERFLRGQQTGDVDPADVPALTAGSDFPGPVPDAAERANSVKIPVKTALSGWASTGRYAPPGETIVVKIDPSVFAKFPKPFKVRIGTHSDSIWHKTRWTRFPEITLEKTIVSPETKLANPFGGLVYVVVPNGIESSGLGEIEFEISGTVAAPYFVRGATSLDAWKAIRDYPAPWAELQGDEVVITVPSRSIRKLDNPQTLLETWDRILRLEDEFASGPFYRDRLERITCDREISAGYMHSGYPVMTHMDAEGNLVNAERLLTSGDWGFFHEFGHNHQSRAWTFDGSVEVTVNYFTLYVMEKLCGLAPGEARAELTKENRLGRLRKYIDSGASFDEWKSDPFLALNMTVQLRDEFGWEPFLRAISEYRKIPAADLPKDDLEKRDQWMIRLSRNTGKNLGPFFEKWGVPTSQSAKDSLLELPVWLPSEFNELE